MLQLAILGAGAVLSAYGKIKADMDQAEAEKQNASFYREQADFAKYAGDRKQQIFNNETVKLQGAQGSAFAKAGVDTSNSSMFMAKELFYRQKEEVAIKLEADMNVRLAMLRADQATKTAEQLGSFENTMMTIGGAAFSAAKDAKLGASSKASAVAGNTDKKESAL